MAGKNTVCAFSAVCPIDLAHAVRLPPNGPAKQDENFLTVMLPSKMFARLLKVCKKTPYGSTA
ncbi:hypothetical protein [Azohydromonas australica]|uniref:hypothetical protein n=1 Tax=Azohydromonas australica TaxID=364039 RepID=UPI0012EB1B23|nr:hypothetical protein [Azohydromonas australica]